MESSFVGVYLFNSEQLNYKKSGFPRVKSNKYNFNFERPQSFPITTTFSSEGVSDYITYVSYQVHVNVIKNRWLSTATLCHIQCSRLSCELDEKKKLVSVLPLSQMSLWGSELPHERIKGNLLKKPVISLIWLIPSPLYRSCNLLFTTINGWLLVMFCSVQ